MSAMANATPLVTTVTKHTTNPRDADATPRVNIQVLSIDLTKLTRQVRPNPVPGGRIPGIILGAEAVPTVWTLQKKIVQRIGNASAALENHMMTLSPTPIVMETALAI
nr:hypothetical protein [Tanacetum cinerariifolium]